MSMSAAFFQCNNNHCLDPGHSEANGSEWLCKLDLDLINVIKISFIHFVLTNHPHRPDGHVCFQSLFCHHDAN